MVVMDHYGLFIYLDSMYPTTFHDVNILCKSNILKNWHYFFVNIYEYFEYILKDPSYMSKDMFVMWQFWMHKLVLEMT
jgi:hypothetical protein